MVEVNRQYFYEVCKVAVLNFNRYKIIFMSVNKHTTLDIETDSCGVVRKSSPHRRLSRRRGQLILDMSMCVSRHVCVFGLKFNS